MTGKSGLWRGVDCRGGVIGETGVVGETRSTGEIKGMCDTWAAGKPGVGRWVIRWMGAANEAVGGDRN